MQKKAAKKSVWGVRTKKRKIVQGTICRFEERVL